MHTLRQQLKQILTFFLFIAMISACNLVVAETTEAASHDSHHAQNSLDWPGIYHGFLPCVDCNGVKTELALNKNNTYILIIRYVGKSEREFVEKGKFAWNDKNNTIVLTPRKGEATEQRYFVGENELVKLDNNGNRITGKLADRYILRRIDVTKKTNSHAAH